MLLPISVCMCTMKPLVPGNRLEPNTHYPPVSQTPSTLSIAVPDDFSLPSAVCSYGYFLLAPNRWDPDRQQLLRTLQGRRDRLIHIRLRQSGSRLTLACNQPLERAEQAKIKHQAIQMLRLDQDLSQWYHH